MADEAMSGRAESDCSLPRAASPSNFVGSDGPPAAREGGPPPTRKTKKKKPGHVMQKVELVTMNGDVITAFEREVFNDTTVGTFIDELERGFVWGVPGARKDNLGECIERFRLATPWGEILGLYDYFEDILPAQERQGRQAIRITLIKQRVEEEIYVRTVSYTHLRAPRDRSLSRMPSSA